jgi:hypothetical protein
MDRLRGGGGSVVDSPSSSRGTDDPDLESGTVASVEFNGIATKEKDSGNRDRKFLTAKLSGNTSCAGMILARVSQSMVDEMRRWTVHLPYTLQPNGSQPNGSWGRSENIPCRFDRGIETTRCPPSGQGVSKTSS